MWNATSWGNAPPPAPTLPTTTFILTSTFTAGDEVIIQGVVVDKAGDPLPGATVSMEVQDAGGAAVASLIPGSSDSLGRFELG